MLERDESTILLTGATGVLGWLLARRFAEAGHEMYLLVRKGSRKAKKVPPRALVLLQFLYFQK